MHALLARLRFVIDHRWAPPRMSSYIDSDLKVHQRARMERHVSECRRCRGLLAELELLIAGLHRLPAPAEADATTIVAAVRVRLS
jgi:anti-sigma factor RsiW